MYPGTWTWNPSECKFSVTWSVFLHPAPEIGREDGLTVVRFALIETIHGRVSRHDALYCPVADVAPCEISSCPQALCTATPQNLGLNVCVSAVLFQIGLDARYLSVGILLTTTISAVIDWS